MIKFQLGGTEVFGKLEVLAANAAPAFAAAGRAELEVELTEARYRTPVATGALRASGYVAEPQITERQIDIEIGFGGPAAPYALYVHENLSAHHKVGQAKFLESVLMESAPFMAARIAERVRLSELL